MLQHRERGNNPPRVPSIFRCRDKVFGVYVKNCSTPEQKRSNEVHSRCLSIIRFAANSILNAFLMQTCNMIYRVSFEPRPSEEITWYRGIFFNHPLFTSVSLLHFDLLRNLIPPRTGRRCALTRWKRGIRITAVGWKSADLSRLRCRCNSPESRNIQTLYPTVSFQRLFSVNGAASARVSNIRRKEFQVC